MPARIESLLAARLFVSPQLVGDRLYFMSNMSGHLSLYVMDSGGSVPEPLLPPDIAMQNPELMAGYSFYVFERLGKILVMLDQDGDENYQPMFIPIEGGFPEPAFGGFFSSARCACPEIDKERDILYLLAESRTEPVTRAYRAVIATEEVQLMGESAWGLYVSGLSPDGDKAGLTEGYTMGDGILWVWDRASGQKQLMLGKPLENRAEGETVPLNSIADCHFTPDNRGMLFVTTLFEDTGSLGFLSLDKPFEPQPVEIKGIKHQGMGELYGLKDLTDTRYLVRYNIDGADWAYEGEFDQSALRMTFDRVICGEGELANGVIEAVEYTKALDTYALAFSTAISPTQLYLINGGTVRVTNERILGIPAEHLSVGEDASFTSHDGMRISARLYLPAESLGYSGPRPLVYYIHGGPQSQERPNFAWFSMPLIQFLTMNGFAVFVPNARGSSGYGISYMKHVDRDWGGQDRLDHVHAMGLLGQDPRIDAKRAGVVGRSYGGYMTLTLASRHPELWSAAVDMFGPYDLLTFMDRIPATWKPYFAIAVGDPVKDHDFLVERSPRTYMHQMTCPMLVIQGKNDPRVVEQESRDVVESLRAQGKQVDYLMFENEGHDVLKFENRVRCYNAITDFFKSNL